VLARPAASSGSPAARESGPHTIRIRVGIAWRVTNNNVLRAGYGISYNDAAYGNIVQQLAFQPPFAVTQTNIASASLPLTLQNGFPSCRLRPLPTTSA